MWVIERPWTTTVGTGIFYDDVFCYTGHAVRMPQQTGQAPAVIWKMTADEFEQLGDVHGPQGWHGYGSPVKVGNVVYYHQEKRKVSGIDAATGKILHVTEVSAQSSGEIYPSATAAGGYLFCSGVKGFTTVLQVQRDGTLKFVAMSTLRDADDRTQWRGNLGGNMLVFSGDKVYVHFADRLACIGGLQSGAKAGPE